MGHFYELNFQCLQTNRRSFYLFHFFSSKPCKQNNSVRIETERNVLHEELVTHFEGRFVRIGQISLFLFRYNVRKHKWIPSISKARQYRISYKSIHYLYKNFVNIASWRRGDVSYYAIITHWLIECVENGEQMLVECWSVCVMVVELSKPRYRHELIRICQLLLVFSSK